MGFRIKYHTLLELKIWNHFFLNMGEQNIYDEHMDHEQRGRQLHRYNAHRLVAIQPTPSCLTTLAGHEMILREIPAGIVIAAREKTPGQPWITFGEELKLTFVIKIIDPEFYNYSNLLLEDNNRKIYYFNNLILSPEHRINLEPKTLTPETLEYLFSRPRTNINGPVYHYHLLPGVRARIEVFREAPPLAKPMVKQMVQNADKEEAVLQLPLHHLPSGWHRIKITNADTGSPLEESTFYLNTDGWGQDTLAIVEFFGRIGDDDYALLNADGTWKWEENAEEAPGALLPARFELRIENRSTIWRYIDSKTHDTKHETELKPLTSNGYIPISPEGQLLPNPSARMIKILDNGDACSEIFI